MTNATRVHSPPRFDFGLFATATPSPRLLLLDYDGTLSPFHPRRLEARPYPGVVPLLRDLASRSGRVAIVSGRPVEELIPLLEGAPGLELWGSHGWEHRSSDGRLQRWRPDDASALQLAEAARMARAILPDDCVEVKIASVAAHVRPLAPAAGREALDQIGEVWAAISARAHLVMLDFDGGLEIRDTTRTKATIVDVARRAAGAAFCAYLGDDLTDEDAFGRLTDTDWGILVTRQPRPSAARYTLQPPEEVLRFLDAWRARETTDAGGLTTHALNAVTNQQEKGVDR